MKINIILLFILLLLNSCNSESITKPTVSDTTVEQNTLLINAELEEKLNPTFNKEDLIGIWLSQTEIKNGLKIELKNIHTLQLMPNGDFKSLYMPNNHKTGHWELINDSIFELYMKAVDRYQVLQISDTTLSCQLLFNLPDTIIINYLKETK